MPKETRQPVKSVAELEALLWRVAADIKSENGARQNTSAASEEYLKKGDQSSRATRSPLYQS